MPRRRYVLALALTVLGGMLPGVFFFRAIRHNDIVGVAWYAAALLGAVGFGIAAASMQRKDWLALGAAMTSVVAVSVCLEYNAFSAGGLRLQAVVVAARSMCLYVPVSFVVEEVSFRGVVDDDFADERRGLKLLTAIVSSALWGLWHLPIVDGRVGTLRFVVMIVVHILVGTPLALAYRRSGNLIVPALVHSFADSWRNGLASSVDG